MNLEYYCPTLHSTFLINTKVALLEGSEATNTTPPYICPTLSCPDLVAQPRKLTKKKKNKKNSLKVFSIISLATSTKYQSLLICFMIKKSLLLKKRLIFALLLQQNRGTGEYKHKQLFTFLYLFLYFYP